MASQARGLYEVLVTQALASRLQNLDARLHARKDGLRPAEAADRIALHLGSNLTHSAQVTGLEWNVRVSTRHADFMADFFDGAGLRVAAVHSDATSAPRAGSLERLQDGELDVVFAVDMFNEGVDVPAIDTVMMLRPTESSILWLQQFGRGLRTAPDKERLTVIDYIGNHRTFLLNPQTLFQLDPGDAQIARALDLVTKGEADLPPGCEVRSRSGPQNCATTSARRSTTQRSCAGRCTDWGRTSIRGWNR